MPSTAGKRQRLVLVTASLILSVLIGAVLSRQGRTTEAPKQHKLRIGLSFDTLKEERWQRDRAAFVKRATELGAEVVDLAANSSDTQQMRDVESLLTSQVNALVIVAHNGAAMSKAVRLAHAAGVPVIAYDRLIPEPSLDFYISFDAVAVGAAWSSRSPTSEPRLAASTSTIAVTPLADAPVTIAPNPSLHPEPTGRINPGTALPMDRPLDGGSSGTTQRIVGGVVGGVLVGMLSTMLFWTSGWMLFSSSCRR